MNKIEQLQEETNKKMQQSFNKVLKLVSNGDFMLEHAEEKILNKKLDDCQEEELLQRNQITLVTNFTLKKLPGKEVETKQGNIVDSQVLDTEGDEVNNKAIDNLLNDFLVSKINNVFKDMDKSKIPGQHIDALRSQLLKEMKLDDDTKSQIMQVMINNKPVDEYKESMVVNNFMADVVTDLFNNAENQAVENVMKKNPDADKDAVRKVVHQEIEVTKQEVLKEAKKSQIEIDNLKEDEVEKMANNYFEETLLKINQNIDKHSVQKSEMVNPEVASQIQQEIQTALKENLEQNNKVMMNSFINLMKSQYYKSAIRIEKKQNQFQLQSDDFKSDF